MGRKKKTLLQALKASALAHRLAVLVGVKPNGHQLARWYERRQGLPYESESNSIWRGFLEGSMPQKARLSILVNLEPELLELLNHPLWDVMDEESDLIDIFAVLENKIYPTKSSFLSSLENDISTMSALDRISLFVLMILTASENQKIISIVTIWLVDSYAQLRLEPEWHSLGRVLLNLILTRFEGVPWFSSARFISCDNNSNHKFWSDIFENFKKNHPGSDSVAWATWCSSISRLNWLERKRFQEYINDCSSCNSEEKNILRKKVYKKVRDRRYKIFRKTPKLSIDLLKGEVNVLQICSATL